MRGTGGREREGEREQAREMQSTGSSEIGVRNIRDTTFPEDKKELMRRDRMTDYHHTKDRGRGAEEEKRRKIEKEKKNWIAKMQKFSSSCSSASLCRSEVTRIAARRGGMFFLSRAAERLLLPLRRPAS